MRSFLPRVLLAGTAFAATSCNDASDTTSSDTAPQEVTAEADFFPPDPTRDLVDLVAGCEGMSPRQRPRGSNCHGVFPEQCGADKAVKHLGDHITPELRTTITAYSPSGDVRFIKPGDAVIEDLRYGRLNVLLDGNGMIIKADCY